MKSDLPANLREKYSKYLYDYTNDDSLDSDEKVWVAELRAEKVKPWSAAEDRRSREISDVIYKLENAGDEWCEFYDHTVDAVELKTIELKLPGRRATEICIYKSWLVYAKNYDENDRRVKRGARVPGTVNYDVVDDGNTIDETYLCYKTLADVEHAVALYIQDEVKKYVKESRVLAGKSLVNKILEGESVRAAILESDQKEKLVTTPRGFIWRVKNPENYWADSAKDVKYDVYFNGKRIGGFGGVNQTFDDDVYYVNYFDDDGKFNYFGANTYSEIELVPVK